MLSRPSALPQHPMHADADALSAQLQARSTSRGSTPAGKPQEPKAAATELASLFILQVLQAMRRTVPKDGMFNKSFAQDTYVAMFDQEIAQHIAQREDLGLNALLQRQLKQPAADHPTTGRPAPLSSLSKGAAMQMYRQRGEPPDALFIPPLAGQQTSGFGRRWHPIHQDERFHHGLDIAAPSGSTIRAAATGQVVLSGTQPDYGNVVILQHPHGYTTLYAHNTENLVAVGDTVHQGQPIATVGRTGNATGPHLHFEIQQDGARLDPVPLLHTGTGQKRRSSFSWPPPI